MSHETGADAVQEKQNPFGGFLKDFNEFQTEIKSRMNEQDQKIGQCSRKSAHRPALSAASEKGAPHQKAMET